MLHAESKQLPLAPVLLICALFIAVLVTSLFSKLAGCGTVGFWLVQAAVAPALAVIFWAGRRVLRKVAVKRAAQYDFHGDISWTQKNSVLFPAICSLSGVIAGLFGLVSWQWLGLGHWNYQQVTAAHCCSRRSRRLFLLLFSVKKRPQRPTSSTNRLCSMHHGSTGCSFHRTYLLWTCMVAWDLHACMHLLLTRHAVVHQRLHCVRVCSCVLCRVVLLC
jgi:hypothetical protein